MQQGHPRHKQLSRARHETALHNRCKAEGVWSAIGNVMTDIGNAISVVITRHLVSNVTAVGKQMDIATDKFEIKDIATDKFRNNAGIVGYGKSQTL